ncbi:MAG: DUF1501 domain-containing protein, partial [Rhodoferax sp.]
MKRRNLLKSIATLPLAAGAGQLWAAPTAQSRVLIVFLRGAYDCCSLLVPISSNFYYESRPDIAVPRPGIDPNTALPLNPDWGLHPVLRDTIY